MKGIILNDQTGVFGKLNKDRFSKYITSILIDTNIYSWDQLLNFTSENFFLLNERKKDNFSG
jgi:hypothetical protein